ncbi:MAG TPA: class I SAM-dependent methyltransferase [Nevskia sp.]|nr:class I SAM-dependent methyltransferase [Nevskia sp.]
MQHLENLGNSPQPHRDHVPETRFGVWFLNTETWAVHVLRRAVNDLERLIPERKASYPLIVDVGCGWGRSFELLQERFAPRTLIGIDVSEEMLKQSARTAAAKGIEVDLRQANSARLPLPNQSVDLLFCHQTFHHLVDQEGALAEFRRVLKPGGVMLFAESTRKYIHSWIIRLLFRHPMEVQKTAEEYLAMVRGAGFEVEPSSISYPYLWWSRSDLGIFERWFRIKPRAGHEETLINLVARRV